MLQTPQEITVWYILPAIRRELAKAMLTKNLKQKQVAKLLGITEAAVSQYLRSKRAKQVEFNKDIKLKIQEAANNIINARQINSLEDLAAISYIGASALTKLRDYSGSTGEQTTEIEGVTFTSTQAANTLNIANTLSLTDLDDKVGLTSTAANNITGARPINSLEELAAISYIGASALTKLRDY